MNFYNPQRLRMGDRPCLLWEEKPVLAVIPPLVITPREEMPDGIQWYDIEVCTVVAPNTARWFTVDVTQDALEKFCADYLNNPEEVLRDIFGWSYNPTARAEPRSGGKEVLTLADLGL